VTVGQLAIVGMGITDIVVSGNFSTDDLAGVSLGSAIFNLSIMLTVGLVLGNGPIIGQLYGAGDISSLRNQFQSCLFLCVPLGFMCACLVGVGIFALPLIETSSGVAGVTVSYLLPMVGAAFLLPFMMAYRTTFESMGYARPAMTFNLIGFLLNIPLDYALVFGKWGLPAMGGAGCGWATLLISFLIIAGETFYARAADTLGGSELFKAFSRINFNRIRETLRIGLPIGGAILAEGGFFLLIPLLVAHLGAVVVSGHSVAISFDWAMFMIPMGISQAISVLSAHELGLGNPVTARRICISGLALTTGIALVQASFVIIFRDNIAAIFSSDPEVQKLAALLLIYAAAFRVFDAINVGGNGALRGYKDTRITVILAVTGYWIIGFPLSYTLALTDFFGPQLGVEGFWIGMVVTLILTSFLTTLRVNQTTRRAINNKRGNISIGQHDSTARRHGKTIVGHD
jgi:MATE family multidrug resistance protein